nr:hypothetical protein [Tanacetum cinerariifolium]
MVVKVSLLNDMIAFDGVEVALLEIVGFIALGIFVALIGLRSVVVVPFCGCNKDGRERESLASATSTSLQLDLRKRSMYKAPEYRVGWIAFVAALLMLGLDRPVSWHGIAIKMVFAAIAGRMTFCMDEILRSAVKEFKEKNWKKVALRAAIGAVKREDDRRLFHNAAMRKQRRAAIGAVKREDDRRLFHNAAMRKQRSCLYHKYLQMSKLIVTASFGWSEGLVQKSALDVCSRGLLWMSASSWRGLMKNRDCQVLRNEQKLEEDASDCTKVDDDGVEFSPEGGDHFPTMAHSCERLLLKAKAEFSEQPTMNVAGLMKNGDCQVLRNGQKLEEDASDCTKVDDDGVEFSPEGGDHFPTMAHSCERLLLKAKAEFSEQPTMNVAGPASILNTPKEN